MTFINIYIHTGTFLWTALLLFIVSKGVLILLRFLKRPHLGGLLPEQIHRHTTWLLKIRTVSKKKEIRKKKKKKRGKK